MTTKAELLAAVRAKCVDCAAGSFREVELCGSGNCALRPFRFGTDPTPARTAPEALVKIRRRAEVADAHPDARGQTDIGSILPMREDDQGRARGQNGPDSGAAPVRLTGFPSPLAGGRRVGASLAPLTAPVSPIRRLPLAMR